jgi:putative peptide zinc metalloprotease protein
VQKSLYSSSWYQVADIRPCLRSHARIHRHHYRGHLWYVLQDRNSGRYHRFTPAAYLVISLMNGERSVREIWDLACVRLGDDVLTQDEMIGLLAQLHRANVLRGDNPTNVTELAERGARDRTRQRWMRVINPLALRLPLLDPDRFLAVLMPFVRPLFSLAGALLTALVVGYAGLLAVGHWPELTNNIGERVLATESLLLLLIAYPLIKALHELGHGLAVKHWGGEVHEMGIMFLVFMPVPYVDASSSAAFHQKRRRAIVGAAGILVEALLASIALFAWLNMEESMLRAFAFNVMLIGGVSTLLFNGNPLLKFDGYYVLCDLIEMPNLAQRSNRYLGYLIQRYLFGLTRLPSPASGRREAAWLFGYSIASFAYRLTIMVVIVTFVANQFFFLGVLIAFWSVFLMIGLPLLKQLRYLFASPALGRVRRRAVGVTAAIVAVLGGILLLLPLPYRTVAEGVVWTPEESTIYAGSAGTVAEILAPPNSIVTIGDPLLRLEDPLLDSRVRVLESQVSELELRKASQDVSDPAEARIINERLDHAMGDLALARQRQQDLLVRSTVYGRFLVARAQDLPGRFLRQGEVIGYVARLDRPVIRVVVPEASADRVRQRVSEVEVRFVNRMDDVYPAEMLREVPAISDTLPSLALSTVGGGDILLDPSDATRPRALTRLMQIELAPLIPEPVESLGARAYVRFNHGNEPLAFRMYRAMRQLFLRNFNV